MCYKVQFLYKFRIRWIGSQSRSIRIQNIIHGQTISVRSYKKTKQVHKKSITRFYGTNSIDVNQNHVEMDNV